MMRGERAKRYSQFKASRTLKSPCPFLQREDEATVGLFPKGVQVIFMRDGKILIPVYVVLKKGDRDVISRC